MARRDVTITRISPTSAFRVGLALSLVGLIAWMLAVCLLYIGLNQVGIWESLNSLVGGVGGGFEVTFGVVPSHRKSFKQSPFTMSCICNAPLESSFK